MNTVEIWTDGSYRPSTDVGGIGVVVVQNDKVLTSFKERYEHTTNNRMEITALIAALGYIRQCNPIDSTVIYTDSQYCLGIINSGWKRNTNKDLWEIFDAQLYLLSKSGSIEFKYTKGHADDQYNNMADKLATEASGYTKPSKKERMAKPVRLTVDPDADLYPKTYEITYSQELNRFCTVDAGKGLDPADYPVKYASQHLSPLELIAELKRMKEDKLAAALAVAKDPDFARPMQSTIKSLKYWISECEGWTEGNTEIQ